MKFKPRITEATQLELPLGGVGVEIEDGKVKAGGREVEVLSEEEAESCDLLICGETSYFADDEAGECTECGRAIVFRPHAPKRPRKVCLGCALKLTLAAREEGGDHVDGEDPA